MNTGIHVQYKQKIRTISCSQDRCGKYHCNSVYKYLKLKETVYHVFSIFIAVPHHLVTQNLTSYSNEDVLHKLASISEQAESGHADCLSRHVDIVRKDFNQT